MDQRVADIIARAQEKIPPSYDEVLFMLGIDETSPEATAIRSAGNDIQRAKNGNAAAIWGQIGIDVYPCEADCQFCSFGISSTCFTGHTTMPIEEVVQRAKDFTRGGDLYGLYLMCMNSYDEDYYLECVKAVKAVIPPTTLLVSNIGDTDQPYFEKLKAAGLDGAYHVKRIGEGVLTKITPERRDKTIYAAHAAGLRLQECCEPIGAETPLEEVADRMWEIRERAIELNITDSVAAMMRNSVPGTRFESKALEMNHARLGLINAIQVLLMSDREECKFVGFHECNSISMISGGNAVTAESGFNPRDTAEDTAKGVGLDVPTVRQKFYQAGFRNLALADGTLIPLTPEYMEAKLAE